MQPAPFDFTSPIEAPKSNHSTNHKPASRAATTTLSSAVRSESAAARSKPQSGAFESTRPSSAAVRGTPLRAQRHPQPSFPRPSSDHLKPPTSSNLSESANGDKLIDAGTKKKQEVVEVDSAKHLEPANQESVGDGVVDFTLINFDDEIITRDHLEGEVLSVGEEELMDEAESHDEMAVDEESEKSHALVGVDVTTVPSNNSRPMGGLVGAAADEGQNPRDGEPSPWVWTTPAKRPSNEISKKSAKSFLSYNPLAYASPVSTPTHPPTDSSTRLTHLLDKIQRNQASDSTFRKLFRMSKDYGLACEQDLERSEASCTWQNRFPEVLATLINFLQYPKHVCTTHPPPFSFIPRLLV